MIRLSCTNCHTTFLLHPSIKSGDEVIYGKASCKCTTYPIVEKIVLVTPHQSQLIGLIEIGSFWEAFCICIGLPKLRFMPFLGPLINFFIKQGWSLSTVLLKIPLNIQWNLVGFISGGKSATYFRHRNQETDSLFAFLPAGLGMTRSKTHWLNVGTGIHNYYHQLAKQNPKLTIYALDQSFSNCFFSQLIFPSTQTYYLCGSITNMLIDYNIFNLITFFDTLQFIEQNQKLLQLLAREIDPSKTTMIFSGVVHQRQIINQEKIYPLSSKKIASYFPKSGLFINDKLLAEKLQQSVRTLSLKKLSFVKPPMSLFKYTFIYPRPRQSLIKLNVPNSLKHATTHYWSG